MKRNVGTCVDDGNNATINIVSVVLRVCMHIAFIDSCGQI